MRRVGWLRQVELCLLFDLLVGLLVWDRGIHLEKLCLLFGLLLGLLVCLLAGLPVVLLGPRRHSPRAYLLGAPR